MKTISIRLEDSIYEELGKMLDEIPSSVEVL